MVGPIIAILEIISVLIGNTNSIRVVDDRNENETASLAVVETSTPPTKLVMPLVTTTSNLYDNNRTNDTYVHNSGNQMTMRGKANDSASRVSESLLSSTMMNMSSNKTTPSQQFQLITRSMPKIQYETLKKFVPSPELIVDESQSSSSESNEKFIIKNHYRGIPKNKKSLPLNNKSRNILATNVSEKSNNIRYFVRSNKKTPFNESTISTDTIHHSSMLTESDKLPWPIPYRDVAPEFKWKIVRPTNMPHQQNQIDAKHTVEMNDENLVQEIETKSNSSIEKPTHIYPSHTSEQSQSYHPYEFESIHSMSNINTPPPSLPTTYSPDDIYAQSIDHLNETTNSEIGHHTKDGLVHIEHINNEVLWHTAMKWLATVIPIGLAISAFAPNIVYIDANSTTPYPPILYPMQSASYLRPTTQTPLKIYAGRNRNQRLTHDKRKYLAYLEKSKELQRIGSVSAANSCENRYLCELGIVAAFYEKNATQSANTLYTSLWRISNEQPNRKSLDSINAVFTAIQNKNCEIFLCSAN